MCVYVCVWRGGIYSRPTQIQSHSIWPNFHFLCVCVGWGGDSSPTQIQSHSIWPNFHFLCVCVGRGGTPDQLKSKVPQSGQIFIYRGEVLQTNSNPKCQVLTKFPWGGRGEEYSRPTFLKYLSRGNRKMECGNASQIVSHTLRVETKNSLRLPYYFLELMSQQTS